MAADPRTTDFLDTFARGTPPGPNIEDPLSFGGRWLHLYRSNPDHVLRLHSNGVSGSVEIWTVSGGSGQAAIWYQPFAGDVETWAIGAGGQADLREGLRQYLHISNLQFPTSLPVSPYGARTWTGYWLDSNNGVLGAGTTLYKTGAGGIDASNTPLASIGGTLIDWNGGISVLRTIGTQVQWWHAPGNDPTNFTKFFDVTDTTYRFGYIGIGTQQDDNNPSWQGFGGGRVRHSQIYRWLPGTRDYDRDPKTPAKLPAS